MAVPAAARAVILGLEAIGGRQRESGPSPLVVILISALSTIVLIVMLVIYILTSPFEFEGELGAFQLAYAYLLGDQNIADLEGALEGEEIDALVADISNPERREVVRRALTLVGRVPYFWGGKSAPCDWNDQWGSLKLVTAPGSSTSDTYQPYGLDCSGFTDWAYWTALGTDSLPSGGTSGIWAGTTEVAEEYLLPGDLVYKQTPWTPGVNHVGIYVGKDADGKNLYVHCSYSGGGVVLNGYLGFQFFRRPPIFYGGDR